MIWPILLHNHNPVNFQEFFKNLNLTQRMYSLRILYPSHSLRMYDWSTTPSHNLVSPKIILFNNKAQFFLWHERCWRQESQFEVHDLLKMFTIQNNWRVTYSPHKSSFYSFFYRFKKFLRCHCTTSIIEPAPQQIIPFTLVRWTWKQQSNEWVVQETSS
jgi:hypothetical protein